MEEELNKVVPAVTIQPKTVYGLRSDVLGNIHFNQNREVIYPVEAVLAFHDFVTNKQRFLRLQENTQPRIIAISPNRRVIAVLEICKIPNCEKKPQISIYDLVSLKKRRNIMVPMSYQIASQPYDKYDEIMCMNFTADSKALTFLTKPPEENLYVFYFDKADTMLHCFAGILNQRGSTECVACNPQDSSLIAVAGDNTLQLISKSENVLSVSSTMNSSERFYFTSVTWITNDMLIAGTNEETLWLIEVNEIKAKLSAKETEIIDLLREQEEEVANPLLEEESSECIQKVIDGRVVCMMSFPRGFAYAIFNQVFVYERDTAAFRLERKTILTIKIDLYPEESYQIMNLAINAEQDTIIATTKHNQIYAGVLIMPESLTTKRLNFKPLGEYIHIDEIIDISMCSWKPIILTASKDHTIRIWNYETEKIELVKKYQIEVTGLALNPNGLYAAIGFSDQLRLMAIFLEDFKIVKTYNFPRCKSIAYSNYGHLMAAAHDNLITVTSVYSLETLKTLKGHNGNILSVAWSQDDKFLVSGGVEGAVYQWDIETGARVHEVIQKGVEYRSLAVTHDPLSIYAITNLGSLRELSNSEIAREIKTPSEAPLLSICLSRSDMIMFLSSDKGHLYSVQLPFLDTGGGTCTNYRFFDSAVTKLAISHDGTLLVSATKNGTLAIWVLKNIDGRIAQMDQDLLKTQEVLIPRNTLEEKIQTIANLELRLKQQMAEFQHQINQNEIFDEQQLNDIHKGYCAAIEELKKKNQEMEQQQVLELNQMTQQIEEIRAEHDKEMKSLSQQYSERMLSEYNKFSHLRENMLTMRETYEEKLRNSAGSLQDTIEALETDFKKQLRERQELIRELMQEMEDKKVEFIEYCRQVEADNDRNMVESQCQFEKKLKEQQDEAVKWRGEAGVIKKKYNSISSGADKLREENQLLKEELLKHKNEIEKCQRTNDDLYKEIEDREFVIGEKEKRIQELMQKNQELEKYKQVLTHKINELKAQIEPRERQIKDKRNQIVEMERELEGLHANNLKLELLFNEKKDKYVATTTELKTERERSKAARNYIAKICSDIYRIAGYIDKPDELKIQVRDIFKKYADDREMKKSIELDLQVKSEFQRQRDHLEKVASACENRSDKKMEAVRIKKLLNENVLLIRELNVLRTQLKDARRELSNIEKIIGIGWKHLNHLAIKKKMEKAVTDVERLEETHQKEIEKADYKIFELVKENSNLHEYITKMKRKTLS